MAAQLHQVLSARVSAWAATGYPSDQYPAISEILDWARDNKTGGLRYLRHPQVKALETYWYLRLVENTFHVQALYRRLLPKQSELLAALGLDHADIKAYVLDEGLDRMCPNARRIWSGHIRASRSPSGSTVAVKVIDMLGEEVLVTQVV